MHLLRQELHQQGSLVEVRSQQWRAGPWPPSHPDFNHNPVSGSLLVNLIPRYTAGLTSDPTSRHICFSTQKSGLILDLSSSPQSDRLVTINSNIAPVSTSFIRRKTEWDDKSEKRKLPIPFWRPLNHSASVALLSSRCCFQHQEADEFGRLLETSVRWTRLFGGEPVIVQGLYRALNPSGWENLRNKEVPWDSCCWLKWYKRWILRFKSPLLLPSFSAEDKASSLCTKPQKS